MKAVYINGFVTRNGLTPLEVWPSIYGGWYADFNRVTVEYCFDFTISEVDVWNRVAKRVLIPGELDFVKMADGFNWYPEEHWCCYSFEFIVEGLSKRGLLSNSVQLKLF